MKNIRHNVQEYSKQKEKPLFLLIPCAAQKDQSWNLHFFEFPGFQTLK